MVTPGLVPLFRTYWEYFVSEETNPFTENFAAVISPYALDPSNAVAAHKPAVLSQQVYSLTMSGDPMEFLLCHPTLGFDPGDDPGRLGLVHSISQYDTHIDRPTSPGTRRHLGHEATS